VDIYGRISAEPEIIAVISWLFAGPYNQTAFERFSFLFLLSRFV